MDYKKQIESQLNNLAENKQALEIIPQTLKMIKQEVYLIQKTLSYMNEEEKRVIQRTCIDNISPYDLEEEFGCSYRKIYKLKDAALSKITKLIYGSKYLEEREDNKNVD